MSRCLVLFVAMFLMGCPGETPAPGPSAGSSKQETTTDQTARPAATPAESVRSLPKISLGKSQEPESSSGTVSNARSGNTTGAIDSGSRRAAVLAAMKPMQILRDSWNAIRQKDVGGQDAGETQEWIWDFRTDRAQPALVMNSPNGKYFQNLRLTYDPSEERFELTMTDSKGKERFFAGTYSVPVQEIEGADRKIHRVYKLQLDEINPASKREHWQIVINQQENNRYLLELSRKRGNRFLRFETISAQRNGTSFALSDSDYGEKTCIISGGLGTIAVSYQGKTYWVCCSGCKAAFEEEPARWITEFEAKQADQSR